MNGKQVDCHCFGALSRAPVSWWSVLRNAVFLLLAGLVFGIFTLTFVVSGLVSMNPWGFLEGRGGGGEHVNVDDIEIAAPAKDDELLAVHEALDRFAQLFLVF